MLASCRPYRRFVLWSLNTLLFLMLLVFAGASRAIAQGVSGSGPAEITTKSTDSPWLSLNYTGALYGYYRIEPTSINPARNWAPLGPGTQFPKHEHQDPLLLGMGDNFGPEFGASVQRELNVGDPCYQAAPLPDGDFKDYAPEALYKDSKRLPTMAECDNVGRFLMYAGYRAIVPGREDFLYSARWLRRMALLFQGASVVVNQPNPFVEKKKEPVIGGTTPEKQTAWKSETAKRNGFIDDMRIANCDHELVMLAANLRLNFSPKGKVQAPSIPGSHNFAQLVKDTCPLLFSWNRPGDELESCVTGDERGNTVTTEMDWLRRLDLTVASTSGCTLVAGDPDHCFPLAKSMNMRAHKDITFRRQMLENQAKIALSTLTDEIERAMAQQKKWKDVKAALQILSSKDHKTFNETQDEPTSLSLSTTGTIQVDNLKCAVDADWPAAVTDPKLRDLKIIVRDLHTRFFQVSHPPITGEMDFLFSLDARKAAIRLLLRKIANEQENIGYTIVRRPQPMANTLVIGVVGQDTMHAVSSDNFRVCAQWPASQIIDVRCDEPGDRTVVGTVKVGDPLTALTMVLRAAWVKEPSIDRVVVMAQMPRTEAEELAAHALASLRKTMCSTIDTPAEPHTPACSDSIVSDPPHIDLILSEAQIAHTTPKLDVQYAGNDIMPVIAPKPAWYINRNGSGLQDAVSTATITGGQRQPGELRALNNSVPPYEPQGSTGQTMADLLNDELKQVAIRRPSTDLSNLENFWNDCRQQKACQDSVVMQYLLEEIHRSSQADVVFLEYRDFYFGDMLGEYGKYAICDEWVSDHAKSLQNQGDAKAYCRLRVALDRILWKGDYSERVMVDGKNLKQMLATAKQETDDEQTLAARDTVDEWLMTYGIVTHLPQNLSAASMGPATFVIPGVTFCVDPGADTGTSKYCVNGQRVTDDGAYWVGTSDHLAEDNEVYKVLKSLDPKYHMEKKALFITAEIAGKVFRPGREEASEKQVSAPVAQVGISKIEELQQKRPILQMDVAKLVAGFMLRAPNVSNTQLGTIFSGVADSRAATPSAQELDLEALTRMTRGLGVGELSQRLKAGIQSDFEYDRAVTGNVTGSPPTVTYALNSLTVGGFLQFRLLGDVSKRLSLVAAPFQYQTQITGNYLPFKFSTGSGPTAQTGQITVPTPRWEGFAHRFGVRYEFGRGLPDSYAEGGPEYSTIHNVLSGLMLPNGMVCPASQAGFIPCVGTVTASTVLRPLTETLHAGGAYWTVHLQKPIDKDKRWSFTFDTKGDYFMFPGVTLPTQSRYAFTTTEALNVKAIGNLVFSPTYTQFFYRNQGTAGESHSLVTQTFAVTAKWYFVRDAAVPFWRQLLYYRGPASMDQTKSAKMQ